MKETLLGALLGGFLSWIVSFYFYKKQEQKQNMKWKDKMKVFQIKHDKEIKFLVQKLKECSIALDKLPVKEDSLIKEGIRRIMDKTCERCGIKAKQENLSAEINGNKDGQEVYK